MAFSKPETMGSVIQDIQPDIIINAAAYTAVDREGGAWTLSQSNLVTLEVPCWILLIFRVKIFFGLILALVHNT